jgi:hypothetical protein
MSVLQPRLGRRKAHPNLGPDILLLVGLLLFVLFWGWIGYAVLMANLP